MQRNVFENARKKTISDFKYKQIHKLTSQLS